MQASEPAASWSTSSARQPNSCANDPSVSAESTTRPVMTTSAPSASARAIGKPPRYALALSTVFDGQLPFATSDLHIRYLEPTEGMVRFDAMPLSSLELRSMRRQLGVVVQKPHIFGTTIRANIALGDPGASLATTT